jgi:hypothetical protein
MKPFRPEASSLFINRRRNSFLQALWALGCSRRFGDDKAVRPGERAMIREAPSGAVQPVANLLHAVDLAVAEMHGEFAGHQRRLQGLGMANPRRPAREV